MKKVSLLLVLTVFILTNSFSYAQKKITFTQSETLQKESETAVSLQSYRIDPQPLLQKIYEKIGFDPAKVKKVNSLRKAAWAFQVGSQVSWWAGSFKTGANPVFYKTPSTCRAVGTHCYIFVEDAIWGTSVDQAGVDAVKQAFDSQTPAGSRNSSQGIYQNDVDVFGNPPNVDGDDKIIILILDIQDDFSGPGSGFVAGYFSSYNEDTFAANSNKAEIYYLDGVQDNLTSAGGLTEAMSTTAHEFQHMIHWNYIQNATTFFNECWSLSAEIINGYGVYSQSRYANESNHYLLDWRSGVDAALTDYSRAARFGLYLYEQFGFSFW